MTRIKIDHLCLSTFRSWDIEFYISHIIYRCGQSVHARSPFPRGVCGILDLAQHVKLIFLTCPSFCKCFNDECNMLWSPKAHCLSKTKTYTVHAMDNSHRPRSHACLAQAIWATFTQSTSTQSTRATKSTTFTRQSVIQCVGCGALMLALATFSPNVNTRQQRLSQAYYLTWSSSGSIT